jgi:hypothetical protein
MVETFINNINVREETPAVLANPEMVASFID